MWTVVRVILEGGVRWGIKPKVSCLGSVSSIETISGVFMKLMGSDFDFLNKKLSSLYVKAETLIKQDVNPESLNKLLHEINDSYSLLKKVILNHVEPSKGEFLSSNLSRLQSEKAGFHKNSAEWLAKITPGDTDASAATTVMVSTISSTQSNGSSSTSRCSLLLTKIALKQKIALLLIRHLQEVREFQEKELDI